METAVFLAVFFFSYTMQAITGFAGNIFSMPVGTLFFGLQGSVSILNALGFLSCGALALMNRRDIDLRQLAKIVSIMTPFVLVGIWVDTVLPLPMLMRIYGVIVVLVGLKGLLQKKQHFLPEWALVVIIALAGLIQGMFVSGGALLVIYALQKITDKQRFRATLSAVWGILNFFYAALSFGQGHFTGEIWNIVLLAIPLAAIATVLGNKLQKRISQQVFLRLTYVILLAVGVILFATAR